jgi:hypothetical protein
MIPQLATLSQNVPMPLPSANVTIRPAVMEDVAFIDSLQKLQSKQVGWMPTATLVGKVKAGHVIVAWAARPCSSVGSEDMGETPMLRSDPVGYLIGQDQYFKHDDVGIIYQINVAKEYRRSFVAAALLKAQFERSAYGCKLYCCWCAQDIEANQFWESMGFVPLAFRAGSEKKSRVHIFWQKRIRQGDATTPWWFPSKTAGGSIREDRLVLPIPPGTHWSDAKPMVLPTAPAEVKALEQQAHGRAARGTAKKQKAVAETPAPVRRNGLMFDIPKQGEPLPEDKPIKAAKPKAEKVKRACDPQHVAAARELRDRWLEHVNATPLIGQGKYEVSRAIAGPGGEASEVVSLLPAA